jgi:NAD(P)H-hydrate repair Nnr-like enzyme with NAD(P)H-hydrate dehydratase domain
MTVDGILSSPAGGGDLGTAGAQLVSVGATLHVGAGQVSAAYSGSLPVTVAYN